VIHKAASVMLAAHPLGLRGHGAQECWSGTYTFQRCCIRQDPACWDESSAHDYCCSRTNQSVAWWSGGGPPTSWAHVVLWCLSARMLCQPSPHLSRGDCCSAPDGVVLSSSCWDGVFSRGKCCGYRTPRLPSARGDSSCWIGGLTYEHCCEGEGNPRCWDYEGTYTFARCCTSVPASQEWFSANLSTLEELAAESGCVLRPEIDQCARLWRTVLPDPELLADRKVQQTAVHLVRRWSGTGVLSQVAAASPAFLERGAGLGRPLGRPAGGAQGSLGGRGQLRSALPWPPSCHHGLGAQCPAHPGS